MFSSKKKNTDPKAPPPPPKSFLMKIRDNVDALVFAFFVAMFFRTFVVELYQVPTGSMTPTLMGDYSGRIDLNGDGKEDIVLFDKMPDGTWILKRTADFPGVVVFDPATHSVSVKSKEPISMEVFKRYPLLHPVFLKADTHWEVASPIDYLEQISQISKIRKEFSRIIIAKYYYWFHQPQTGDIMMFKTPAGIYDPQKPKYIKRICGVENQQLEIREPHLYVNSEKLDSNPVIAVNHYLARGDYTQFNIPADHFVPLGDNSSSSYDARYWGPVPNENIGGRALLCFWPLSTAGFIK